MQMPETSRCFECASLPHILLQVWGGESSRRRARPISLSHQSCQPDLCICTSFEQQADQFQRASHANAPLIRITHMTSLRSGVSLLAFPTPVAQERWHKVKTRRRITAAWKVWNDDQRIIFAATTTASPAAPAASKGVRLSRSRSSRAAGSTLAGTERRSLQASAGELGYDTSACSAQKQCCGCSISTTAKTKQLCLRRRAISSMCGPKRMFEGHKKH